MAGDRIDHNSVGLQTSLEIRINDTDSTTLKRRQVVDFLIRNGGSLGSEYEKMVVGSPFQVTGSPKLQALKLQARRFCTNYNQDEILDTSSMYSPEKFFLEQRKRREELLHTIIGRVGEDAVIEPPFNFLRGQSVIDLPLARQSSHP